MSGICKYTLSINIQILIRETEVTAETAKEAGQVW